MTNWQRPKKPIYTTGRIVINSDDGRLWDYTQYFKIIQKAVSDHNQFKPLSSGIFCPAINTGYVDDGWHETVDLPMMSWDMIEEIASKGGEILSHGKYHLYLDGTPITQSLNIGDTTIHYSDSQGRPREGFKFYITDGVNRDDFTVTSYNHIGTGEDNTMLIDTPLTYAYDTIAKIHLHEDMAAEMFGGIVSDLTSHGIECKHHINAWYNNSDTMRNYLEQYFESVLTMNVGYTELPSETDVYAMLRTFDLRQYDKASIDALLDDVQTKDSVAFVQNHGGNYLDVYDKLDYLVSQAMQKGVRLITHSEAVDYIKSMQV